MSNLLKKLILAPRRSDFRDPRLPRTAGDPNQLPPSPHRCGVPSVHSCTWSIHTSSEIRRLDDSITGKVRIPQGIRRREGGAATGGVDSGRLRCGGAADRENPTSGSPERAVGARRVDRAVSRPPCGPRTAPTATARRQPVLATRRSDFRDQRLPRIAGDPNQPLPSPHRRGVPSVHSCTRSIHTSRGTPRGGR